MVANRRILLIIGGGIAAYKSLELIRMLKREGASVTPVLTGAGAQFVTPLSVSALAGERHYTDLFDLTDEAEMGHIELSRAADLLAVVPATADLMAKMAGGHANDLGSTLLMATDKPVMIAPAMNVRMWNHPATQRNAELLRGDGVKIIGPDDGAMACGEFGPGRMVEPAQILQAMRDHFAAGSLAGKRVLVTSGPTHEPIDPVRYIANRSSGRQGAAIAASLRDLGADVIFVTGPAEIAAPPGVQVIAVETAREMLAAVESELPVDAAVFAAAVADWYVASAASEKIKKTVDGQPDLQFVENPDILAHIAKLEANRPKLVIGFAAETSNLIDRASAKLHRKGCDWIVANDVSEKTGIMGGAENEVSLITAGGQENWPRAGKREVAERLAHRIAEALA